MSKYKYLPLLLVFKLCAGSAAWAAEDDPLTLTPSADTFLADSVKGNPAGLGSQPILRIYGGADKKQFRALLKFDLSAVKQPPTKAVLRLRVTKMGILASPLKLGFLRCHALVRDWSEEAASWDMCLKDDYWANQGGDWDPAPAGGCHFRLAHGWFEFDVTGLVQAWVLKRLANYGCAVLFDPGSTVGIIVNSRESPTNKPELKLAWKSKLECSASSIPSNLIAPYGPPVKTEAVWVTTCLPLAFAEKEYSYKLVVRGGVYPRKFTAEKLPDGLKLSEDGQLSGAPLKDGQYHLKIICAGADNRKLSKTLDLNVQLPAGKADDNAGDKLAEELGLRPHEKQEKKAESPKFKELEEE